MRLTTGGSIINEGGSISAGRYLMAYSDSHIRNTAARISRGRGFYYEAAVITAGDGLILNAGGNIENTGSDITSGGFISLAARGDIINRSAHGKYVNENVNRSWRTCRGSWFWKRCTTHRIRRYGEDAVIREGRIKAGDDLTIDAGGMFRNTGSLLQTAGKLDLYAGRGIELKATSVELRFENYSYSKKSGWFGISLGKGYNTSNNNSYATAFSVIKAGSADLFSNGDFVAMGAEIASAGDLSLTVAGDLMILPLVQNLYNNSHGKKSGLFGYFNKSNYKDEGRRVVVNRSSASSGDDLKLRSTNGNVVLKATNLKSGGDMTLTADNGQVALLVDKESEYKHQQRYSENLVWWKSRDKGSYAETVVHNHLLAGGAITFRAANGVLVEYRDAAGNLDATIASLARAPELAWMAQLQGRNNVQWRAVQQAARHWDHKSEGLTEGATALIMLAVTMATQGAGASLLAGTSFAGNAIAANVVQSAITKLASTAAVSLINNKGDLSAVLKELGSSTFAKSLATSVLTAGLIGNGSLGLAGSGSGVDLTQRLQVQVVNIAVKTGVETVIGGAKFEDALLQNIGSAVGSELAFNIGQAFKAGDIGKIEQLFLHASGGALSSAIAKGDPVAGALGAVIGEVMAEVSDRGLFNGAGASGQNQSGRTAAMFAGQAAAIIAAALTGRDVSSASSAASRAIINNYLTPKQLADVEKSHAECRGDALCEQRVLDTARQLSFNQDNQLVFYKLKALAGNSYDLDTLTKHLLTSYSDDQVAEIVRNQYPGYSDAQVAIKVQAYQAAYRESFNASTVNVIFGTLDVLGMLGASNAKAAVKGAESLVNLGRAITTGGKDVATLLKNIEISTEGLGSNLGNVKIGLKGADIPRLLENPKNS